MPQVDKPKQLRGGGIFPPRYLHELPDDLWFWKEYGCNHARARQIWTHRRQLIRAAEAQNWRCCYCGAVTDIQHYTWPRPQDASREHVVPRSQGGGDGDDNIVMACHRCNARRSSTDAYGFVPDRVRYFAR